MPSTKRKVINFFNLILFRLNLKIESRTTDNIFASYLLKIQESGLLFGAQFPLPNSILSADFTSISFGLRQLSPEIHQHLYDPQNAIKFDIQNGYFGSPDADVLFCMIRKYQPKTVIEIGCGNSTKVIRAALDLNEEKGELLSIDPNPRIDIEHIPDQIFKKEVESLNLSFFSRLRENDLLFIDSSHTVKTGTDVIFLLLKVLPVLSPGVIVHIHDIFLPYEYPESWVKKGWGWNEQYLLQGILFFSDRFEVLWPGFYFQNKYPEAFSELFPKMGKNNSQSLYFKIISQG